MAAPLIPTADCPDRVTPALLPAWRKAVRRQPWLAASLLALLLAMLALSAQGVWRLFAADTPLAWREGLLGGLAGAVTTALGAALALALRQVSARSEDAMLGFAAGMMLAASAFSLILPGLAAARELTGHGGLAALVVCAGISLGVVLMLGLDQFMPHAHPHGGPCGPGHARVGRVWLFVWAIALHNLPEGMAIGVGFAQNDWQVAMPLTTAIAVQDIPEGLAVAISLRAAGMLAGRAVLLAAATGLMEPLGALLGVSLSSGWALAYPLGLGLAAGAMLFVVSHEVIPETHRHGHQTTATLGLMAGFMLMLALDTGLG
mgnify:FL=1